MNSFHIHRTCMASRLDRIFREGVYLKPECILSEGKWLETKKKKETHHVERDLIFVQRSFGKWCTRNLVLRVRQARKILFQIIREKPLFPAMAHHLCGPQEWTKPELRQLTLVSQVRKLIFGKLNSILTVVHHHQRLYLIYS